MIPLPGWKRLVRFVENVTGGKSEDRLESRRNYDRPWETFSLDDERLVEGL